MEINVPLIIGSVPFNLNKFNLELNKNVIFLQNRKDRPVSLDLSGETYFCNKTQVFFLLVTFFKFKIFFGFF